MGSTEGVGPALAVTNGGPGQVDNFGKVDGQTSNLAPSENQASTYLVRLRPEPHVINPIRALRSCLKSALRRYGLRCVGVREDRP
jgi:hypothetical protein